VVSVLQTQTEPQVYCVYQYQFLIIKVQVSPTNTQGGASLDVTIQFEYIDGSPVNLGSAEGDFLLLGTNYSHVYQRVHLTATGNPGEYQTSLPLASDIPMGYYKVYCVHCTFTDGSGNWAPNSDTSSDETSLGTDNSAFLIGPATATTATGPSAETLSASLLVGLGILLLIVILIAALLLRRRKK
jgi:hypothetical protein